MEIIYLSLHCHHQNDSGIKMGSGESHFNVSLIVRNKVTIKTVSTDLTLSVYLLAMPFFRSLASLLSTTLTETKENLADDSD